MTTWGDLEKQGVTYDEADAAMRKALGTAYLAGAQSDSDEQIMTNVEQVLKICAMNEGAVPAAYKIMAGYGLALIEARKNAK